MSIFLGEVRFSFARNRDKRLQITDLEVIIITLLQQVDYIMPCPYCEPAGLLGGTIALYQL
jgi:hypothetical protein